MNFSKFASERLLTTSKLYTPQKIQHGSPEHGTLQKKDIPFENHHLQGFMIQFSGVTTLSKTNGLPLKIGFPKRKGIGTFQPLIFKGDLLVSGRVLRGSGYLGYVDSNQGEKSL